jgi:hypothetical protein
MNMKPVTRAMVCGSAALALAIVFAAYLSPHMVVDLATRLWACF